MRIAIIAGALVAGLALCTTAMAQSDLEAANSVKEYYNEWLSSIPGVTAVDVGASAQGQPEIQIHAVDITDQIKRLPHTLNGFPVVVIRDARNPDEGALGGVNQDDEDQAANAVGAGSPDQSAPVDVNNPAVNKTDRSNGSVAPPPPGAPTGLPMPVAPTADNPLGIPLEGTPPKPEGVPPPALR